MFEALIRRSLDDATAEQKASKAAFVRRRQAVFGKARKELAGALDRLSKVLPRAVDCVTSVQAIRWRGGCPQSIKHLVTELNGYCSNGEKDIRDLLAMIERSTPADVDSPAKSGDLIGRSKGLSAVPSAMETLIRRIQFEVNEALPADAYSLPPEKVLVKPEPGIGLGESIPGIETRFDPRTRS